MDYKTITDKYYSMWVGMDISGKREKVEFVYCTERDTIQPGYGNSFDLWIWSDVNGIIVSYGTRVKPVIDALKENLCGELKISEIKDIVQNIYSGKYSCGRKLVYCGNNYISERAHILSKTDYDLYEKFYQKCNPKLRDISWLREYFDDMSGMCCGIVEDGMLVCCTDAPQMPYMNNLVQEIGINTLTEYRGRHFASDCAALCVEQITKNGKCPQWSCGINNIASLKTAERVGFKTLGEYICVTLD